MSHHLLIWTNQRRAFHRRHLRKKNIRRLFQVHASIEEFEKHPIADTCPFYMDVKTVPGTWTRAGGALALLRSTKWIWLSEQQQSEIEYS